MTPSIRTRLTERFGLKHPFACAGLAFVGTTPPLAVAIAKAGGVGALGVGKLPPPAVGEAVAAIRSQTDGVLNVNFITIFTTEDHIALCEELRPPVVSFHWGHPPLEWIRRLRAAGISVWEQVGSVEAASRAVGDGVDVVIAQGSEAGGHNYGEMPLFALLPAIIDQVAPVMVLAAGSIADGRGVAAALALGADGVWVGTRMVATTEGDAAEEYKRRLVAARSEEAVLTNIFGRDEVGFNPMRVLANRLVTSYRDREDEAPSEPASQPVVGQMEIAGMEMPLHRFGNAVPMSSAVCDIEEMPLLAGQGVGLIRHLGDAATIMDDMMHDARAPGRTL